MTWTTELNTHSFYSFLDGACSPEELANAAADQGLKSVALTDRDGLYGVIPFYRTCKERGIKAIIGADLTLEAGERIVVLCPSQDAYHRLSQAITEAYRGREKADPQMSWATLAEIAPHVIALANPDSKELPRFREFFAERLYLAVSLYLDEGDQGRLRRAAKLGLPLVATNRVRYASRDKGMLYDVLRCIKARCTLSSSHHHRPGNHQRYLKVPEEMEHLFKGYSDAIQNAGAIADLCDVDLDFSSYRLPDFPLPEGHDANSYLAELCYERSSCKETRVKLEHELALIQKLKLSGYFLVVWDIVQFARRKGIPVQGRGSAANSLVAYTLGITPVDPVKHKLFLGRFINEDMVNIPDIDLDFASSRDPSQPDREDVIRYIYERYGEDHVAMVCTYITFQARSAIREVGRVFELPDHLIDRLSRLVGRYSVKELAEIPELQKYFHGKLWEQFSLIINQIAEVPRHQGIHVGGMIISSCPISKIVPIEPARMEGRLVCQWDKDMVDDADLIKVDILGLGMLAVMREAEQILEAAGTHVDLFQLDLNDQRVYQTISDADTVGVFQVESRAQMQSLPRTRPSNFDELGVQVAIIRPGPLQGNMVAPYIRRKQGEEPVRYLHPSIAPALEDTLGVILFQEQVLQVAVALAGFTSAQAEGLRRAMSRRRSQDAMRVIQQQFLDGASERGVSKSDAEAVFHSLEGFALYGFCKSHALSFAKLSYISAWLKVYHPAVFTAALLNNQPMGFYPIETLLEDAKRHGVGVRLVDINHSQPRCHIEDGDLRLGFILVKGLSDVLVEKIIAKRPFNSMRQFFQACHPSVRRCEALIQGGAFDSWGLERRDLLWQLWLLDREAQDGPTLFDLPCNVPKLPKADVWALIRGEYQTLGLSLQGHPMLHIRPHLGVLEDSRGLGTATQGLHLRTAGMLTCRQRPPTAKGFAFLTVEDEYGMMNWIIPPQVYEKHRALIRQELFILATGIVDRKDGVVNLKVRTLDSIQLVPVPHKL